MFLTRTVTGTVEPEAMVVDADVGRPVSVTGANAIELSLSCTLVVAAGQQAGPAITAAEAAVSDLAGGLFSAGSMGIGRRLYRSALSAALMVPGVAAVHELTVSWGDRLLGEAFDPGDDSYFDLPPGNVTIGGVNAGD